MNRSALVVKAKQPFLDWLRSLPDPVRDMSLDDLNEDRTAYLVADWYDDTERDQLVRKGYGAIFKQELAGWWTVENDWPKKRTFKVFRQWFDVEFHSMLVDLVEGPIEDDEA